MQDLNSVSRVAGRRTGLFIVFEGIDGSGKSTQAQMLFSWMKEKGVPVILTAEPSDGPIGRKIRALKMRPSPEKEAELFTQDRFDHLERTILPALKRGTTVICDRYVHSSVAYQGARGIDVQEIMNRNNKFAIKPDSVFLLEVPVDLALSRIATGRAGIFSAFEVSVQLQKVASIYGDLEGPDIMRIDGTGPPEQVHKQIVRCVRKLRSDCELLEE
jgi:dTMP kinase